MDGAVLSAALEFLAFNLGGEEYCIDIQKVQELRSHEAVTHIANAPEWLKGVINLRGAIVPIVDLRIKLNLGTAGDNPFTVVIIVNVAGRVVGMVVDSVSDVITLDRTQIKPAPEVGSAMDTDYMVGIGMLDERMLILADIERLISGAEMGVVDRLAA
ncbi:chemotaxis protein CheW [Noviherbaspirillum sp.]|uniref:chemotaxis protein CheW n=1 Tax=Noviherbaspirillum sp. TaxID=1926288 RepID=UPI002B48B2B2|nr:chemotaxis protein CheW [Noviherbaspirillum sp.]HJV82013.1 chemotaxis protein CheW [Noviherbaspirillum sp.]